MRPTKVIAIVVGAVAALIGMGLLIAGSVLVWAHTTQRDDDGYYTSRVERLATPTAAITSEHIDFGTGDDTWNLIDRVGTVRLRVEATEEAAIFVGIADQADVDEYLSGVAHDELVELDDGRPVYESVTGERRPTAPGAETFWEASAEGTGRQELTWELDEGEWAVVVMNADGSATIAVEADAGISTGWLLPIGIGLLAGALVSVAVAIALLVWGSRRDEVAPATAPPVPAPPASPASAPSGGEARRAYPLRLDGHLDVELSRWLWLVKWFLAIPHLIVLVFLWAAFAVLTVVAGVAILFTGRYPRSIFDFNVGVLRWTWRVTFYAFALGTDRYPPFTLDARPGEPAALAIERPERLSRPLVLVKWWLLALPHYVVIGVFGGGALGWWGTTDDRSWAVLGGGLIGVLVVISAVALLFTRRYPQALFDFVMGMERWTYRVIAYAALMTDEYPPFRLDAGGTDPGSASQRPVPRQPLPPPVAPGAPITEPPHAVEPPTPVEV